MANVCRFILADAKQILNIIQVLTDIEAHLAVICASLPALQFWFRRGKTARVSNIYPSRDSHFARRNASRPSSSTAYDFRHRTTASLRYSISSKGQNNASSKLHDRVPTPDSGAQRNDCRCTLCASIDALEKGLISRHMKALDGAS